MVSTTSTATSVRRFRIELPFQTVEPSTRARKTVSAPLELSASGNDPEWRNRLNLGRQEVRPALAAARVRRQGGSDLH